MTGAGTAPPLVPSSGRSYNPVVTLNGWTLPWRMNNGVKEFHLVAELVVREMAPGFKPHMWGYNGQSPGPTIEVVKGDRVHVFVTNRLPEHTSVHWHADEMTQMAMGMMGFNLWTWNSRIFPGIDKLNERLGDKVRIRIGNLTMTNHPMHLHGHEFMVTGGGGGGPWPMTARWPEVTTDVAVGQMRQLEFVADEEGDWAFHCHKSHHTMNAIGHAIPATIGVDHRGLVGKLQKAMPDYMVMGERGMADMGKMEMPIPKNTAPMMTGTSPYGGVQMGGMFSVLKVRKTQKPGDYKDSG